jgi:thiamine biosynthesis lipoprotein
MSQRRKSNRRDFLQGKSAVQTIADLGQQSRDGESDAGYSRSVARPAGYLIQFSRRAMACQFEIFLNAGQYSRGTEAALQALDLVEQLEDQMTVFRDHSEISELNRTAASQAVEIEPRLFALLEHAVRIYRETNGAYDVTAGPLSRVWGFTRRRGAIPDDARLAEARARVGSHQLELNASAVSVRFRTPGIEINLGSIGKGYALDRCADRLRAAGVYDFLLHGGQSSVLAGGSAEGEDEKSAAAVPPRSTDEDSLGTDPPARVSQGWLVGVRDPLRPRRRLGQIRLRNRALATSGSGAQFFMHGTERYGHILDPRTGWPARGVLSTTVVAPSAAEADALSTAFYVMGPEATEEYCRFHRHVGCLMSCPGKREGALDLGVFGLDEADWIPAPAAC